MKLFKKLLCLVGLHDWDYETKPWVTKPLRYVDIGWSAHRCQVCGKWRDKNLRDETKQRVCELRLASGENYYFRARPATGKSSLGPIQQ